MKSLIFPIAGLVAGISLIAGGTYYLIKEKDDKGSVKIYGTFIAIGAVITIALVIKILVAGF